MLCLKLTVDTKQGNLDAALEIYEKALKVATEKEKMHIIPILYIHFFRLKFMVMSSEIFCPLLTWKFAYTSDLR